jgi:hypothetical protein
MDEQLNFGPESRINKFLQQSLLKCEQAPVRFNFSKGIPDRGLLFQKLDHLYAILDST